MRYSEFKTVLREAAGDIYAVGDSHAVAIKRAGGFAGSPVNGASVSAIARQVEAVPEGATVVLSAGNNDITRTPGSVVDGVNSIINSLKRKQCRVVYVVFPAIDLEGPNREIYSRAGYTANYNAVRNALRRTRADSTLELTTEDINPRDSMRIHATDAAYARIARAVDAGSSEAGGGSSSEAGGAETAAGAAGAAGGMGDLSNTTGNSFFGLFGKGSAANIAAGNEPDVPVGQDSAGNWLNAAGEVIPGMEAGAAAGGTAPNSTGGSISSAGVNASQDLITMLKGFEGYGEKVNPSQGANSPVRPYWDVRQWSIGYGSYAGSRDRNQRPNIQWTPQEAEAQLQRQLVPYRNNVESINRRGNYQWTGAQLDALTSFAYNIGSINQLTNNGRRSNREIADAMLQYANAGGQRVAGLVSRRRIEREKFMSGMAQGRLDYRPGGAAA